jgi:hypothetical protein
LFVKGGVKWLFSKIHIFRYFFLKIGTHDQNIRTNFLNVKSRSCDHVITRSSRKWSLWPQVTRQVSFPPISIRHGQDGCQMKVREISDFLMETHFLFLSSVKIYKSEKLHHWFLATFNSICPAKQVIIFEWGPKLKMCPHQKFRNFISFNLIPNLTMSDRYRGEWDFWKLCASVCADRTKSAAICLFCVRSSDL